MLLFYDILGTLLSFFFMLLLLLHLDNEFGKLVDKPRLQKKKKPPDSSDNIPDMVRELSKMSNLLKF